MKTLTRKDLSPTGRRGKGTANIHLLSSEELEAVGGGRSVPVTVDGRTPGTVDDFAVNLDIYKGNIKGSYI